MSEELKNRRSMTLQEYVDLLRYIDENHSFKKMEGKMIKYIEHVFDFRTNNIHCVRIHGGLHEDMVFSITNENRDRDLTKWVYEWLENNDERE